MSADNGQIIRERKDGKFYLYSYQGDYTNTDTPKVFDTLREAVEYHLDPEAYLSDEPKIVSAVPLTKIEELIGGGK